ncbi:hypothetical protein PY793_13090 [Acetobacter fabarum]
MNAAPEITLSIEKGLSAVADKMRRALNVGVCKHIAIGLHKHKKIVQ